MVMVSALPPPPPLTTVWKACSQCWKPLDILTARKETLEIQTRAMTKNYIIIYLIIRMIFTRCSGILVFTLQFCFITSRPAGLLVNLNKLLMSELNKYLWGELRVEIDHESRSYKRQKQYLCVISVII